MRRSFLFVDYLLWHYTVAFKDILLVWLNLVWFAGHFFSMGSLIKTLFSPWKRIHESYSSRTGLEALAASFVVNIMTRIVGAFVRISILLTGVAVILFQSVGIILWLILWIVSPVLCLYAFVYGIMQFI